MSIPLRRLIGLAAGLFGGLLAGVAAAQSPAAPVAPAPPPMPFADEIARFAELDALNPPPACPVVFVGSSSVRLWAGLAADMAPLPVLNRGFGGAQIGDVIRYFDAVVGRYHPRAIVFYAGENDLDAGRTPDMVLADFQRFLELKTEKLGATPVHFVSIKPSRARFGQFAAQSAVNAAIRDLVALRTDVDFIDVASAMVENGAPKDIYVADGLHMSLAGYSLWTQIVGQALRLHDEDELLACTGDLAAGPGGPARP